MPRVLVAAFGVVEGFDVQGIDTGQIQRYVFAIATPCS
jgi:hypothetical protein